jgi:HAMP domain-containing protein
MNPTPPRTGFRKRVVVAILAIGIASVAVGLVSVFFIGRASLEGTIGTTYQELAEITARGLDHEVRRQLHDARTLAQTRDVVRVVAESNATYHGSTAREIARQIAAVEKRWVGEQGVDAYLHALLTNDATDFLRAFDHDPAGGGTLHKQILVTDAHGAAVAATRKPVHYDYSDEPWWRAVMETGAPRVSGVEGPDAEGAYTFRITYPVRQGDEVTGAVSMVHDAPRFFRAVTDMRVAQTDHTMLVGGDGEVIFCPILPVKSHHLSPGLQALVLHDRSGWASSTEDLHHPGRLAITGYAPVDTDFGDGSVFAGERWYIVTSQDPKEAFAPIYALLKWVALTGILGALAVTGLGFVAARSIIRPIHELRAGVERVSAGDLAHPIHVTSGDEIEGLAAAFNRMTEKLNASYSGLEAKIAERTRELESKNRELFALFAIVSTLNRLGHTDEGFADVIHKILTTLHADAVSLAIYADGRTLASYVYPSGSVDAGGAAGALEVIETEVRAEREPLYIDDLRASPRFNLLERDLGYLGVASCPVVSKDGLVGVLHLLDRQPRTYTTTERALVESIVNQLAISIENLRLSRDGH